MSSLVGHHRATGAALLRPAVDAGLEEETVDDELPAALEEVEQAHPSVRPLELVVLLHQHPRHPAARGGHRVTSVGVLLLLHQQRVTRLLPLPLIDDRRQLHGSSSSSLIIHLLVEYNTDEQRPPARPARYYGRDR